MNTFGSGMESRHIALLFYYQIEICDDLDIFTNVGVISHEDNCSVVIGWINKTLLFME